MNEEFVLERLHDLGQTQCEQQAKLAEIDVKIDTITEKIDDIKNNKDKMTTMQKGVIGAVIVQMLMNAPFPSVAKTALAQLFSMGGH